MLGDYNGDGNLDVVVSEGSAGPTQPAVLRLLIGDGAGGFGAPINISPSGLCPTATTPGCVSGTGPVRAGDVNKDGKLDIVTANNWSRNLTVILGNGDGTFMLPGTNYALPFEGRSVALGDLNGDGDLDLIWGTSATVNNVRVRLGSGDGTFGAPGDFSDGGINTNDMEVADLNGDGNMDLVVSNRDGGGISVMLGDGLGGLGAPTTYPLAGTPRSVTIGDLNGDGRPDLAASVSSTNQVAVLLAAGVPGSFGTVVNYPAGSVPHDVAAADFDGDGNLDLATANNNTNNAVVNGDNVSILEGDGLGSFAAPTNYPSPSDIGVMFHPVSVFSADLNGDGKPDIATVNGFSRNVSVMLNTTPLPVVMCRNRPATLVGTGGDDILVGTSGDDVIVGLGGNDLIDGAGGNDRICGGSGTDSIDGGTGNDKVWGGRGADSISGGLGNDRLYGNRGHDTLFGNGGDDRLSGGQGNDNLIGGEGFDICNGGPGTNRVPTCEAPQRVEA